MLLIIHRPAVHCSSRTDSAGRPSLPFLPSFVLHFLPGLINKRKCQIAHGAVGGERLDCVRGGETGRHCGRVLVESELSKQIKGLSLNIGMRRRLLLLRNLHKSNIIHSAPSLLVGSRYRSYVALLLCCASAAGRHYRSFCVRSRRRIDDGLNAFKVLRAAVA